MVLQSFWADTCYGVESQVRFGAALLLVKQLFRGGFTSQAEEFLSQVVLVCMSRVVG